MDVMVYYQTINVDQKNGPLATFGDNLGITVTPNFRDNDLLSWQLPLHFFLFSYTDEIQAHC